MAAPAQNPNAQLDVQITNAIATVLLRELSWLETAYGLVQVREQRKDNGSIERFPAVYSSGSEYTDVRYDGSVTAQCFFEREGQITLSNNGDEPERRYPLSVVFWCNLAVVDSSNPYDYTDQLAADVEVVLKRNFDSEIEIFSIDLRSEQAYSKYTLADLDNKFRTYPYTVFKISFEYIDYRSLRCNTTISTGAPTVNIYNLETSETITRVDCGGNYGVTVLDEIVDTIDSNTVTIIDPLD